MDGEMRGEEEEERTRDISWGLSAAPARSAAPMLLGSSVESVAWPGRGFEGMRRGSAAEEGTVVPSTAMSERLPPLGFGSFEVDMMRVWTG